MPLTRAPPPPRFQGGHGCRRAAQPPDRGTCNVMHALSHSYCRTMYHVSFTAPPPGGTWREERAAITALVLLEFNLSHAEGCAVITIIIRGVITSSLAATSNATLSRYNRLTAADYRKKRDALAHSRHDSYCTLHTPFRLSSVSRPISRQPNGSLAGSFLATAEPIT